MPTRHARRSEPHTVIIARGDRIRHFTIRPWLVGFIGSALAAMAVFYLLATSYLVLRDDLIGATAARQARMQQAYEDRISILRTQVDRITSRQLLDQQLVQGKVAELLARQSEITQRHGRISPLLNRANGTANALPDTAPRPEARPTVHADAAPRRASSVFAKLTGEDETSATSGLRVESAFWPQATPASEEKVSPVEKGRIITDAKVETAPVKADPADDKSATLFDSLGASLAAIKAEQMLSIQTLASDTYETADAIREVLVDAGLPVDTAFGNEDADIGGQFVSLDPEALFDERVRELEDALEQLETLKQSARDYPIFNPAPGQSVSSSFGMRRDPFLRRPAMHAGIDFRGRTGTPIQATGAGRVVRAGWTGGYGRLVEIDHGGGWTTRYAHMSRIDVKVGERVVTGDRIGAIGSTGRSTGPHLHYEIRKNGKATDPIRFLRAGNEIADLL